MDKSTTSPWHLCVAPMVGVSDRHCRYFHRLIAPYARLYSEMTNAYALLHGDKAQLGFDFLEHPIALQISGSDPKVLSQAARLGQRLGYDEINLNCGCPSDKAQHGSFGACLMAKPRLVADCIKAMQDAVGIPVTVKHRLGLDYRVSYDFLQNFVEHVYDAGCRVFIIHARNAVLGSISPKENREVPTLHYGFVQRIKNDFPDCTVVVNGGIKETVQARSIWLSFDGLMIGRAARDNPRILSEISLLAWPMVKPLDSVRLLDTMEAYASEQVASGVPIRKIVRPLLGLFNGFQGSRMWRRALSDPAKLAENDPSLIYQAWSSFSRHAEGVLSTI